MSLTAHDAARLTDCGWEFKELCEQVAGQEFLNSFAAMEWYQERLADIGESLRRNPLVDSGCAATGR